MIADGKMDVQLDVSKASRVSRLEVIEGADWASQSFGRGEGEDRRGESGTWSGGGDGRAETWRDTLAGLRLATSLAARAAATA